MNGRASDATVVFTTAPVLAGGSKKMVELAHKHVKPVLHPPRDGGPASPHQGLPRFIQDNCVRVLNVTGPRASKEPGVYILWWRSWPISSRLADNPMITPEKIAPFHDTSDNYHATVALKERLASLRKKRQPYFLDADDFDEVVKWKLRGQYGRQQRERDTNPRAAYCVVTRAAFEIVLDDLDHELEIRVGLMGALRGVGVGVSSAVLALSEPEKYCVVDFRGWRRVFGEEKRWFTVEDYKQYRRRVAELAGALGWPVQEADLAIWEYDRQDGAQLSPTA